MNCIIGQWSESHGMEFRELCLSEFLRTNHGREFTPRRGSICWRYVPEKELVYVCNVPRDSVPATVAARIIEAVQSRGGTVKRLAPASLFLAHLVDTMARVNGHADVRSLNQH